MGPLLRARRNELMALSASIILMSFCRLPYSVPPHQGRVRLPASAAHKGPLKCQCVRYTVAGHKLRVPSQNKRGEPYRQKQKMVEILKRSVCVIFINESR